MNVPKTFQLAGVKWAVREVPDLGNLGETHRDKGLIVIRKGLEPPHSEVVFLHELIHAILFSTGDIGPHDEKFVDGFAYLLHQYMLTAK